MVEMMQRMVEMTVLGSNGRVPSAHVLELWDRSLSEYVSLIVVTTYRMGSTAGDAGEESVSRDRECTI